MNWLRVWTALIALSLSSLLWIGCNDEPVNNNNGITPGNGDTSEGDAVDDTASDAGDDADPPDTSSDSSSDTSTDAVGPCAGVTCDVGEECMGGACVPVSSADACEIPRDLGVFPTDGSSTTVNLRMQGRTDSLETSCGAEGAPEGAIKLRTDRPAKFDLRINSGVDFAYEIRTDACDDADGALACLTNDTHLFYTSADRDYYLILEPTDAELVAPVEVTLSATEVPCAPPGESRCTDSTREVCFVSEGYRSSECGDACGESFCLGDTCSDLITVSGSASFSGDSEAYRDNFDFGDEPTCSGTGNAGLDSPGYDVAFEVTGLTAGQTVTVDASNTNADNYIFVLDSCSETGPCLFGQAFGSKLANWEVPADGDYVFVVDQSDRAAVPFQIDIDIQ